ncbi:Luciferin 4-monooxygenase [Papilio xuthus]|uniref:Luciferin 4-monooxygenase n=1 Tax=Papilio xuthus TaxID=66420 RepID=A0A194PZH5_PAPXU|nr:Luciferin 4-monooxygenase [Papilio xuthus]
MLKNPLYVYGPEDRYVPAKLNAGDFLLQKIWEHKEKVSMINGATDEKLTYGEIAQEAMNLALSLVKLGVRRGDVVAICSENRREYWSTVVGVICAGGVVTTINTIYTKDELKHVMDISKPKYVFCSPFSYKAQGKNFSTIQYIKKIIVFGEEKQKNTLSYNDLTIIGRGANSMLKENVNIDQFDAIEVMGQDDVAMIMYSSGTTGLPKGVMITHLNILTACSSTMETPDFVSLTITPWYHTMGLISHLIGFVKGKKTIYLPKFDVEQYLQTVEKYKVSQLTVVPPVLIALCKTPSKHDVSSVMVVVSGAAPLHKETADGVFKRFPNAQAVLQGYGMTECTLAVAINVNPDKDSSVGQINSNTVVKIVHPETGKVLGPNQEGEICVKSAMIMKGYIGKRKQDDFDEEGFFKTGDIGYYDEDKYLYIVDRLKELIKYKAYQVAPAELEAVLLKHAGVRDSGVVGVPHPSAGEVPLAFVVVQPDSKVTEAELQQFVAERLSNPKHLRGGVRFVEAIPKSLTGKILRKDLRKMVKSTKSKL